MIAEIFLDPKSDVNNEIAKFKNSVLEKLKEKGINDCTILCKEQDDKIHVIAISYVNKNQEEMDKLFPEIIHDTKLGKLKHEYTVKNAVFLAPKCYWLQLEDGNEIVKIKGVKKEALVLAMENGGLNFDTFKNLLVKDSHMEIQQEKWARDFNLGTINIMETTYDIKQNNNKREWIYNDNGYCIDSKPIDINMIDWEKGNNLFRETSLFFPIKDYTLMLNMKI